MSPPTLHAENPSGADNRPFGVFFTIWAGQSASLLGSKLSSFALGVWIFQQTGQVTWLALLMLAATLPGLLIGPWAGAVVDRRPRRRVMLLADCASGLVTLSLAMAASLGQLHAAVIVPAAVLYSLADAFQTPAYMSYLPSLVGKRQLDRANGLVQLAIGLGTIAAPALAGWLLASYGLSVVLAVDFATFAMAAATLLLAPRVPERSRHVARGAWRDIRLGWAFVARRRGLLGMLLLFAVGNLAMSFANVLFIPLVLPLTGEAQLGAVLSIAGLGMLLGSVGVVLRPLPRPRIHLFLAGLLAAGAAMALGGLIPHPWWIAPCAFVLMACVPPVNTAVHGVVQTTVPNRLQGRVQSLRRMLMQAAAPLAYVAAGPLVDHLLEPAMQPGGALAESLGAWIGAGPGRGAAVVFLLAGVVVSAAALAGWLSPPLRGVEERRPRRGSMR